MATITIELSEEEMAAVKCRAAQVFTSPERFLWVALSRHMEGGEGEPDLERYYDIQDLHARFESEELPEWANNSRELSLVSI